MRKKTIRPRRKVKKRGWVPVTPPVLANRLCEPHVRTPRKKLKKKRAARTKRMLLTVGHVRGEVQAVGITVRKLRELLAGVRAQDLAFVTDEAWIPGVPPPPPIGGRLCDALPVDQFRLADLVRFLNGVARQIDAIATQLDRLPPDLLVIRPRRPAPTR